jgi:hypothetical protein
MLHVSIGVLQNRLITQRSRMSRLLLVSRCRQERRTHLRAMLAVTLIILPPQQPRHTEEPLRILDTNRLAQPRRNQGLHPRIHTPRATSSLLDGSHTLGHIPLTRRRHHRTTGVHQQLRRANTPPQGILDTSTNNIWSTAKPL